VVYPAQGEIPHFTTRRGLRNHLVNIASATVATWNAM